MTATDPPQNGDGSPTIDFIEASTLYEQAPNKGGGERDPEDPTEKEREDSLDDGNGEPGEESKNRECEEELEGKSQEEVLDDKGRGDPNREGTEHEEVLDIESSEPGKEPKEAELLPVTIEINSDDSDDSDSDDDAQFMSLPPSPGPMNATGDVDAVANTPAVVPEYLIERLRSLNLGDDAESAPARQRDGSRTPTQKTITDNLDLIHSVKGMYRILDLIQEEGSGGLVDKVIISQESLREFIESLRPGSYSSLTKVDFKGLDKVTIKPVGMYGNREEIVRFLLSIQAIDELIAEKLRRPEDGSSGVLGPALRSGLYAVKPREPAAPEKQVYVIYWPEVTTWDDDAVSSVQRNRVTFLRYLTKVADQVVALVSSDCAKSIVWDEGGDLQDVIDTSNADTDRLFTFEVEKTQEQEENMKIRPGFKVSSDLIKTHVPPPGSVVDATPFKPRLLFGEAYQGFLTQHLSSPEEDIVSFSRFEMSRTHLSDLL
ncbi:hypothetical protein EWM64_g3794 [Hericium alpestre]|uniref:Uncharacterized protein n=1 Tax=Hericium alpestre TaxID=135208 RepID=A0A4Z0A3E6_9AGAM|nr:hypothetical protein EWM64_g3794 [Hericium alpestre]